MLTIQILTENNEKTIEQTLQSIVTLNAAILIGDLGSTDKTLSICRKFKTRIIPVPSNDYSLARNILIKEAKTPWIFYIQPWEVLANGHRQLLEAGQKNSHLCQVFQGNVITKELRLWRSISNFQFINPVYEYIHDPTAVLLKEIIIYSHGQPIKIDKYLAIVNDWKKKNPTSPNPYYYEACLLLQQANYEKFVNIANHYLFKENQGISAVMLKYYLSKTYYYHFKDFKSALFHIIPCLAVQPLMAEFWCLLADITYGQNNFNNAKAFYENAMLLGSRRAITDEWPIEIDKYKKHPQKMIDSCNKMLKDGEYHISKSNQFH